MLGFISPRPFLTLLAFWWPLLLSVKALKSPHQDMEFLLTYWLFYACISGAQYHVLNMQIPLSSIINIFGDLLQIWMFYSHGCLVTMHHYIPSFTGHTSAASIVSALDQKVVDPFITIFLVRNMILQSFLSSYSSSIPPIHEFLMFNRSLCEHHALLPKRLLFLQFSLEYFCYVDLESELRARYLKSHEMFVRMGSSIPTSLRGSISTNDKTRISSKTTESRNITAASEDNERFAWKSAPQTRINSGHVSRKVSSNDPLSKSPFHRYDGYSSSKEDSQLRSATRVSSTPVAHSGLNLERCKANRHMAEPQQPHDNKKIYIKKTGKSPCLQL